MEAVARSAARTTSGQPEQPLNNEGNAASPETFIPLFFVKHFN